MNIKIVKRPQEKRARVGEPGAALLRTVDTDSAIEVPLDEFTTTARSNLYQHMARKGLRIHTKTRGDVVVIYAYKPQDGQ